MNTQNELLFDTLIQFYNKDNNLNKMLGIINGDSRISLRLVDWFSTNYSKKKYVVITYKGSSTKIYEDYKLKLKSYSKKRFDPFCRWERIQLPVKEKNYYVETTIGQLNFFKWIIEKNIIEYMKENFQTIENDMNLNNSISKKKKYNDSIDNLNKTRKRREELSISASRNLIKIEKKTVLNFT